MGLRRGGKVVGLRRGGKVMRLFTFRGVATSLYQSQGRSKNRGSGSRERVGNLQIGMRI